MQRDVELWHLLSFTSGILMPSQCWNTTSWSTYTDCVNSMPTSNPEREPGAAFAYSTAHLDLAGLMAVARGGYADWAALFNEWRTNTELFPGATWNPAFVIAPSVQFNVTAAEYMEFVRAIEACTILPQPLCAQMQADQIVNNPGRNGTTFPLVLPDGTQLHEDWHFGFGLWMECAAFDWSCAYVDRVSSLGVAGQYALIEREHGYRLVLTPSFGPNATARGALFAREIAPLLNEWAALSR